MHVDRRRENYRDREKVQIKRELAGVWEARYRHRGIHKRTRICTPTFTQVHVDTAIQAQRFRQQPDEERRKKQRMRRKDRHTCTQAPAHIQTNSIHIKRANKIIESRALQQETSFPHLT